MSQVRVPQSGVITVASVTLGPFNIDVNPVRNTPLTLFLDGTIGGGTLKAQVSPDGDVANAQDLTGITLSAAGYKTLPLVQGTFFLVWSGATSPNAKWWLQ